MLVILLDYDGKVVESFLQVVFLPGDLAELVICIDLGRVDRDRFFKMFEGLGFLTPTEVNKPELDMSVGVLGIDGGVVKKTLEISFLPKGVAEAAYFAAEVTAKIHDHP